MTIKTLLRSFAGGEITPELFGRLDLAKFQTGLARALNFEILAHGPAVNSPGFEYVLEAKDSTKEVVLIPFAFSTQQTFALEFGDQYIRFHTLGGTLLEAVKNITAMTNANPGVFTSAAHGFTTGQWLFLNSFDGPTILNGRFVKVVVIGVNTFSLTDLAGNAIDTTLLPVFAATGTAARVYEIASPYLEADLQDLHFVQSADVLTITHPTYQQRELKRLGATNWTLTTFALVPTQPAPTVLVVTPSAAGAETNVYVVTALAADGLEESLASATGTGVGVALATAGASNAVTWTNAAGATRYNVYKRRNGLFGYIGQAADGVTGFKDDNITPNMTITPAEGTDPFVGATNFPGAVSYHEQRRCFAGTLTKPQNLWMTRSGTEKNLTYSIPTRDDDSIAFRIAAREANTIRHLVPLSDLLLLTSGGLWRVTSVNSDAITPSSVSVKQQSNIGANNVQPVITGSSMIYAQDRGGRLREVKYSWERTGYDSNDVSVLAPHLLDSYTIVSMCYTQAPTSVVRAVRSDGLLLGMTYLPEHQVLAWFQRDTDGLFKSVCSVAEGTEDGMYAVVKRVINGRNVRYIERHHSRQFDALEDAFFVDSGLTYVGPAATVITGLYHLEGKIVSILADGAVHPQLVVTNGAITLQVAASKVHVGLPIVAQLQTLPLSVESQGVGALGQGTNKNINKVHLRVDRSSGVWAGPRFDKLTEYKQRTDEVYGTPPALLSDELSLTVSPSWTAGGQLCVQQSDPLPLSVVSMTLEVALGG